jgi:isocitrate dehydrogenase
MSADFSMVKGDRISFDANGNAKTVLNPVIPYVEGDGIGPEIWAASQSIFDAAVQRAYQGSRRVSWLQVWAGESSFKKQGNWLPEETLDAFREFRVGIKGPLTTPVGGGVRSINVTLRQMLDLYQCVRPVRWYPNVPSPVRRPEDVNMVIFRENTEDVYAGIEYEAGSEKQLKLAKVLRDEFGAKIPSGPLGLGVKPVSEMGSKRLVRAALRYAVENNRASVTLVHKGNIMKFTEGAFCKWGYEVAKAEFGDKIVLASDTDGKAIPGKIMVRDVIADNMFQQALLKAKNYDVIASTNLNGDYLSDALAAQVGGLGIAPGANIGDGYAIFEATHGTAPSMAGKDSANPLSVVLSGVMMFQHLGWSEVARLIEDAVVKTLADKTVTKDFASQMSDATLLSCSAYGRAVVAAMGS